MASVALAVQSVTDSVRKQPPGSTTNSPLQLALREAQLEQYYEPLRLEGIVDPAELSLVSKQDLDRIGFKKFEKMRFARNFLIGGGGSMHSHGSGNSSNGGGLLDLPLSSMDQQALLQLLTPFLASNGGIQGGSAAAVKQLMAGYDRATAGVGGCNPNGSIILGGGSAEETARQLAEVASSFVTTSSGSSSFSFSTTTSSASSSSLLSSLGAASGASLANMANMGNMGTMGNLGTATVSVSSYTSSATPVAGTAAASSISQSSLASSKDMVSLLFKRGSDQTSTQSDRLQAVKAIRTLLSAERDDIAISIIEQGLLPNLVHFLESEDSELLLEALSALTNLVVSQADHTHFLIGTGIVPVLVTLLQHSDDKSEEILEKAVWVLGNIAGDSAVTRDAVLTGGALVQMIGIIDRSCSQKSMRLLRVSVWCVSNLCDGPSMLPSFPAKNVIGAMIQALGKIYFFLFFVGRGGISAGAFVCSFVSFLFFCFLVALCASFHGSLTVVAIFIIFLDRIVDGCRCHFPCVLGVVAFV